MTGAASELGSACLRRLDARGYTAVAAWRQTPPPPGPSVRFDTTDAGQVAAGFAEVESRWGPVQALVANAGRADLDLAIRLSPERFRLVVDTNLTGTFLVVRAALASMLRRRHGRIVLVASVAGQIGVAGVSPYSASKAGLVGLARSLAREAGPRRVTVNVVAPGMLADAAARIDAHRPGNAVTESWRRATPVRTEGTAEHVASLVAYLASPRAGFTTGAVIPVDGGFSVGPP